MNKETYIELIKDNMVYEMSDEEASIIYDFLVNNLKVKDEWLKDYIEDNLRLFINKTDLFDWVYDEKLYPSEFLDDYCSEIIISQDMVGKSLKDIVVTHISENYIDYLKVNDNLYVYYID